MSRETIESAKESITEDTSPSSLSLDMTQTDRRKDRSIDRSGNKRLELSMRDRQWSETHVTNTHPGKDYYSYSCRSSATLNISTFDEWRVSAPPSLPLRITTLLIDLVTLLCCRRFSSISLCTSCCAGTISLLKKLNC